MENEKIIAECKPTILAFIPRLFFAVIFLLAWVGNSDSTGYFLIAAILIISAVVQMNTTYIRLTDKRLIGHTGFIRSKRLATYFTQVGDIATENGLLGKIFNYHTITVTTIGNSVYKYKRMKNGVEFADTVHLYMAHKQTNIGV